MYSTRLINKISGAFWMMDLYREVLLSRLYVLSDHYVNRGGAGRGNGSHGRRLQPFGLQSSLGIITISRCYSFSFVSCLNFPTLLFYKPKLMVFANTCLLFMCVHGKRSLILLLPRQLRMRTGNHYHVTIALRNRIGWAIEEQLFDTSDRECSCWNLDRANAIPSITRVYEYSRCPSHIACYYMGVLAAINFNRQCYRSSEVCHARASDL